MVRLETPAFELLALFGFDSRPRITHVVSRRVALSACMPQSKCRIEAHLDDTTAPRS